MDNYSFKLDSMRPCGIFKEFDIRKVVNDTIRTELITLSKSHNEDDKEVVIGHFGSNNIPI